MARELTSETLELLSSRNVRSEYLFSASFKDSELRLWTGFGNLLWSGDVWLGNGWLQDIGSIRETQAVEVNSALITLTGVPAQLVSLVLSESQSKSTGRIYAAFFDEQDELLHVEREFSGDLDSVNIDEDPNDSAIRLEYTSKLARLNGTRERRWTNEDQRIEYPSDKGFEYVESLQQKRIYWGQVDTTRGQ